jgi:hypothetical protein
MQENCETTQKEWNGYVNYQEQNRVMEIKTNRALGSMASHRKRSDTRIARKRHEGSGYRRNK